ncbi:Phospholipid scramblase 1 [Hondaea fermentalgiana]|uniref:Phospholipid scramblase n=1 Tax=Hondaea fermentalgiana TaxID=2315210 RepID=A0A2R5GL08_9STRA|nr:Phospholipid scramblase 1 [Hondaea fermentalgiana]|eukprot:GBG31567.1 Phospholipid scramblase 1 [Hondaea fermentalgiana]
MAYKVDSDAPLGVEVVRMKMAAEESGTPLNYAGLNLLKDLDGLFIRQEWEILEQLTTWYEQSNEYTIFDKDGKVQLFRMKEKTMCCYRLCCGENRPFRVKVYDQTGKKDKAALVFKRKFRFCGLALIPFCNHRVDVHYLVDQDNNQIGHESSRTLISRVEVPFCHGGCCWPTWRIKDRQGQTKANLYGPFCMVCDCCGANFHLYDNEGRRTGGVRKLAPDSLKGVAMELVTEADNFKLDFDKELHPAIKMALIAAVLQIDFTFFEDHRTICEGRLCDCWWCGYACPCVPKCCCCCCSDKDKKKNSKERKGAPEAEEMIR